MAGRFLNLFKPIGRILPEIKVPERKVSFNEKIFWTALVLIVYLVMSEIPLYGIPKSAEDQFSALRVIFASNRGTLMELGIGPIVTAGLILQLLAGSAIIKCDMSDPQDRSLFIMAGVAQTILWQTFSPGTGLFVGSLGALFNGQQTLVQWIIGGPAGVYGSLLGLIATV